jgi:hypothetical protein
MLLRKNTLFYVSIYSIHKQLEHMSKSPFYKTGISKSPLFDKGHGKDNESHIHATMTSTLLPTGKSKKRGVTKTKTISVVPTTEKDFFSTPSKPLKKKEDISKKRRARRAAQMKEMQKKLNSMSIDENTIKPGMEEAYDKLSAKIDAHALKTTNLIRGTKYKS